ncbi:MAG: hypothetical protein ACXVEF_37795 [Polyangiales bacterium]
MRIIVLFSALLLGIFPIACGGHDPHGDIPTTSDSDGETKLPERVELRPGKIPDFVFWAVVQPTSKVSVVEDEIAAARARTSELPEVVTELFAHMGENWPVDFNSSQHADKVIVFMCGAILATLRAHESVAPANDHVWRPLPPDGPVGPSGLSLRDIFATFEASMVNVLLCSEADPAELEKLATLHPSDIVRSAAKRPANCHLLE